MEEEEEDKEDKEEEELKWYKGNADSENVEK